MQTLTTTAPDAPRARRGKRGYSTEFPSNKTTAKRYLLDGIPAELWITARAQARREGKSMRALLLELLTAYTTPKETR